MPEEYMDQGVMLGLGAIAEILQKMDARLTKQEEEEEREKEEKDEELEKAAMAVEKAALVKEITDGVIAALKQGGMDVEGKDPKQVSGKDTWPMSGRPAAEDEENPVTLRTSTEEVQKPIQSMQKHLTNQMPEEEEEVPLVPVEEEEGSEEYPVEEDEFKEYPEQMKMLAKEVKTLKKSLADTKKNTDVEIQKGIEAGLQKLGYRKEISTRPVNTGVLGAEDMPIQKSVEGDDVTDQLANLSWPQLAELRMRMEAGQTEGIPKELLQ